MRLRCGHQRPNEWHAPTQRDFDVGPSGELEDRPRVRRDLERVDVPGRARHGEELGIGRGAGIKESKAVVDAGAVRFRPMLLTAAAVVVGASVITIRSYFSRLGPVVNGGRSGLHGAVAYGGAGPLLLVPKGWERGSTQASAFPGKYC